MKRDGDAIERESVAADDQGPRSDDVGLNAAGSHPAGASLSGAMAGAGAGIASAPAGGAVMDSAVVSAGTLLGAAVGALSGGRVDKAVSDAVDAVADEAYWRENFASRDYAARANYESFRPAYRLAANRFARDSSKTFEDVEPSLALDWTDRHMDSTLAWDDARPAARDAWERLQRPYVPALAVEGLGH